MIRKTFEFEISKTKTEILEKVNELLRCSAYTTNYVYNPEDYDFVISEIYSYRNSFKPVFCGKIIEHDNKSKLLITARMNSIIERILSIATVIAIIFLLPVIFFSRYSNLKFESFPVFALLFVIIGNIVLYLAMRPQLNNLKRRLIQ
jgi:hypothetical protein